MSDLALFALLPMSELALFALLPMSELALFALLPMSELALFALLPMSELALFALLPLSELALLEAGMTSAGWRARCSGALCVRCVVCVALQSACLTSWLRNVAQCQSFTQRTSDSFKSAQRCWRPSWASGSALPLVDMTLTPYAFCFLHYTFAQCCWRPSWASGSALPLVDTTLTPNAFLL